jgi:hypothetical protein
VFGLIVSSSFSRMDGQVTIGDVRPYLQAQHHRRSRRNAGEKKKREWSLDKWISGFVVFI